MRPKKLRAKAIEDYLTCPRQYAYGTIYNFSNSDSAYLTFWQATNEAVTYLITQGSAADRNQANAHFQDHWRSQGGDHDPFAPMYTSHAEEVVARVHHALTTDSQDTWQLRQTHTIDLAGYQIEVTLDRIDVDSQQGQPTRFLRTRFGHSHSKPDPKAREFLYDQVRRQHHPTQPITLHHHNLSTGETFDITFTDKTITTWTDKIATAIDGINRDDFTPIASPTAKNDNRDCQRCPFLFICSA
jgi:hypothetical protein